MYRGESMTMRKGLSAYSTMLVLVASLSALIYWHGNGNGSEQEIWRLSGMERRLAKESDGDVLLAGAIAAAEEQTYVRPEGLFNPELPRHRPLDLVIAYYETDGKAWDKPRAAIEELDPFYIMYRKDKGEKDEEVWPDFPMDRVFRLPNVGREGQTYLHHIIKYYDNLADHTLFCQEEPHDPQKIEERMRRFFRNDTGMMGLGREDKCSCFSCFADFPHLPSMWGMFKDTICDGDYMADFQGCFIVSRRRIHAHAVKLYSYVKELVERHGHQFAHLPVRGRNPANYPQHDPAFGHVLERSWSFIFDCADLSVLERAEATEGIGPQCLDKAARPKDADEGPEDAKLERS